MAKIVTVHVRVPLKTRRAFKAEAQRLKRSLQFVMEQALNRCAEELQIEAGKQTDGSL